MKNLVNLLAQVQWDQLEGAYGPATDVPELVHQLADSDSETRARAHDLLADNLNHQGSVYEPAAYLIAPLFWLLKSPNFQGQEEALDLLYSFGRGTGLFTAHQSLAGVREMHGPEEMAKQLQREAKWLTHLHQELLKEEATLIQLTRHSSATVQAKAAQVLTLLKKK